MARRELQVRRRLLRSPKTHPELGGAGVGLRHPHYADVLRDRPPVDWFEIVSDNYFAPKPEAYPELLRIRGEYPIALHGVGLSIAGTDELCPRYLNSLKFLVNWLEPCRVSDHVSWSRHGGFAVQDLLPVAYTRATLEHVANRVDAVQNALGRTLALENPSAYVNFASSTMTEAEFLKALCAKTGCHLLLDVNNLFVTERNLGVDPKEYLRSLAGVTVAYMHLAGHAARPDILVDDHGGPVSEGVAELFREAARAFPRSGLLLEWDNNLPSFATLLGEMARSRELREAALVGETARPAVAASPSGAQRAAVAASDLGAWRSEQDLLWRAITKPESSRRDPAFALDLTRVFAEAPAPTETGLRVYSNVHARRFLKEFLAAYQGVAELVGPGTFAALVQAYVEALPRPAKPEAVVAGFPEFLPTARVLPGFPFPLAALAEVATAERGRRRLLAQPIQRGISARVLATVAEADWPRVVLQVSASCFRQDRRYEVKALVHAAREGRTLSDLPRLPVPESWIMHRTADGVAALRLSPEECRLFDALAAGRPFAVAIDEARIATQIEWLGEWLKRGLFVGFHVAAAEGEATRTASSRRKGPEWTPTADP